jgi:hypothetical protein
MDEACIDECVIFCQWPREGCCDLYLMSECDWEAWRGRDDNAALQKQATASMNY